MAGCRVGEDFDAALEGVDAVMMLRLQRERMEEGLVASLDDYHRDYGLNAARLRRAAADAVVLHPGPMNRGVEIDDDVADGPQSLILTQVANGVAVRMAVLEALLAVTVVGCSAFALAIANGSECFATRVLLRTRPNTAVRMRRSAYAATSAKASS